MFSVSYFPGKRITNIFFFYLVRTRVKHILMQRHHQVCGARFFPARTQFPPFNSTYWRGDMWRTTRMMLPTKGVYVAEDKHRGPWQDIDEPPTTLSNVNTHISPLHALWSPSSLTPILSVLPSLLSSSCPSRWERKEWINTKWNHHTITLS